MGPLTLNHFLVLGALLFAISVVGIFLNRRNLIVLLMAIELSTRKWERPRPLIPSPPAWRPA